MLLKRIDPKSKEKIYVDRFTGERVAPAYVGHRQKVKSAPSTRDAYRIETMVYMVGLRRRQYQERLLAYSLKNNTNR